MSKAQGKTDTSPTIESWISTSILKVDELGVKAASVVVMGVNSQCGDFMYMEDSAVPQYPKPPMHLVFDKPFVLVIRNRETGTMVMMALVCKVPLEKMTEAEVRARDKYCF